MPTGSIPQPLSVMGRTAEDYKSVAGGPIPQQPQSQPSSMLAAGVSMSTRRLCASIPTSIVAVVGLDVDLAPGNFLNWVGNFAS